MKEKNINSKRKYVKPGIIVRMTMVRAMMQNVSGEVHSPDFGDFENSAKQRTISDYYYSDDPASEITWNF